MQKKLSASEWWKRVRRRLVLKTCPVLYVTAPWHVLLFSPPLSFFSLLSFSLSLSSFFLSRSFFLLYFFVCSSLLLQLFSRSRSSCFLFTNDLPKKRELGVERRCRPSFIHFSLSFFLLFLSLSLPLLFLSVSNRNGTTSSRVTLLHSFRRGEKDRERIVVSHIWTSFSFTSIVSVQMESIVHFFATSASGWYQDYILAKNE